MKVVLLPGMDGTGILFDPFVSNAPTGIDVVNVPLIQSPDAGYAEQAKYVMDSIGEEPVILVAESYSGMVAYHMLQMGCANIKHLVFAASFISSPSRLVTLAKYLPLASIKSGLIPKPLVARALFGHFSTPELGSLLYRALSSVEAEVLKSRIAHISSLSEPTFPINVSCSYISPGGDNLVSKDALKTLTELCDDLSVCEVDGTHFVLQTNPQACWRVIQDVVKQQ